jgi:hypothetical protein
MMTLDSTGLRWDAACFAPDGAAGYECRTAVGCESDSGESNHRPLSFLHSASESRRYGRRDGPVIDRHGDSRFSCGR